MPQLNAVPYWRGEGCQNSFVLFDLLRSPKVLCESFLDRAHEVLLREQCDDALILLPHSAQEDNLCVEVIVLEPDRSIAAFCGNGARVVAAYLERHYAEQYRRFSIMAHDGEHELFFFENGNFGVDMLTPKLDPRDSSFVSEWVLGDFQTAQKGLWSVAIAYQGMECPFYFVEAGEPHLVHFGDVRIDDFLKVGAYLNSRVDLFPDGINVNLVHEVNASMLHALTFERGVNRITEACGTGATGCATISQLLHEIHPPTITVVMPGGRLHITEFNGRVLMEGPATLSPPNRGVQKRMSLAFQ